MPGIPVEPIPNTFLDEHSRRRNLVFKGGSVKGIAYVGVRAALEACGFPFEHVERVGGTSAGAMNALAFALNLTIKETKQLVLDLDFKDILDDAQSSVSRDSLLGVKETESRFFKASRASSVAASALPQLSGHLGLYPGEFVRDWMEALIFHKTKIRHCTFQDLHNLRMTTHPEFKDLYTVGFNLNTQVAQTFSVETTPTAIISDAIRVSMSIPFLFQPHCPYYKVDGRRTRDESGHFWIDGGIVENYPVHLFDWGRYTSEGIAPDVPHFNQETLGFYLTDNRKRDFLNARTGSVPLPERSISGIQDYAKAVFGGLLGTSGREYNDHVRRHENQRTIYIDHGAIDLLDFNLNATQTRGLLKAGWDSVCEAYGRDLTFPDALFSTPESEVVFRTA